MALESGTYINDLNENNPTGTDPKSQGDDHLRLIKKTVKNSFPNVEGAVTASHTELNYVDGVTSAVQTQLDSTVKLTGNQTVEGIKHFTGDPQFGPASSSGNNTSTEALVVRDDRSDRYSSVNVVRGSDSSRIGLSFSTSNNAAPAERVVVKPDGTLQVNGTIELGHASDTTLSRIAAGRVAIEGNEIPRLASSNAFTNTGTRQSAPILINNANPDLALFDSDAGANEKGWDLFVSGGQFQLRTFTDAGGTGDVALVVRRSGTASAGIDLYTAGSTQLVTQDRASSNNSSGAAVRHNNGTMYDVGMNLMPPIATNGSTRTILTVGDNGMATIFTGSTTTWVTSTGAASGYVMNGLNAGSGNITLNAGSGQTIYWFTGSGLTSGSRTISPGGVFTLWARTSTVIYLWGSGIS